ncbi:MAG: DUF3108 domain-containing protein [Pseudomonadota bacterium]|nr:DUF3108 domain-containing protein [Pseudomonadota bacterium]
MARFSVTQARKSMTWSSLALINLGLCLSMGTAHALQPFSADYRFSIDNRWNGESTRTLQKQADDWVYVFTARVPVLANATETTRFQLDAQRNVISKSHQLRYKILVRTKNTELAFDHDKQQVIATVGRERRQFTLQPNTLDELNLEFQVREDLKKGSLKPQYWVADDKKIEAVRFVREGREKMTVAAGSYDTVRVRRVHNNPKRTTTFWLAPSLDYLPVRVTQNDDGTIYDFQLTRYQPN